jgi:hypothetical protein
LVPGDEILVPEVGPFGAVLLDWAASGVSGMRWGWRWGDHGHTQRSGREGERGCQWREGFRRFQWALTFCISVV